MMKREISEVILERTFELIDDNGGTETIKLQFGKPYFTTKSNDMPWRCPFQIIGIGLESVQEGPGIDSLNALLVSLRLAEASIDAYSMSSQRRVTWLNEEDLGLSTISISEAEKQATGLFDAEDDPFKQAFDAFFRNRSSKDTR